MANIAIYTFNSDTDTLPTFNTGYEYSYTDVINNDGTTTRTVTSDNLPTTLRFENLIGLISVDFVEVSALTSLRKMF